MKNTFKVLGFIAIVAIIGFSMTACGDDEGGCGRLTITGLGSFDGKYAIAMSEDDLPIVAAKSVNFSKETITGVKIAGGSVTLNVYQATEAGKTSDYKGSGKVDFAVMILNKEAYGESTSESDIAGFGFVTVTFSNGVGSGPFVAEEY